MCTIKRLKLKGVSLLSQVSREFINYHNLNYNYKILAEYKGVKEISGILC